MTDREMPDNSTVIALIPQSGHEVKMPDGAAIPRAADEQPKLLRVPSEFRTPNEALHCALKMNLPNVLVLSELEDGSLVFLNSDMNLASTNWLLDKMKFLMLGQTTYARRDDGSGAA